MRSGYVSAVEQCVHVGTQPHSRHMRKLANPRRLSRSTAFSRRSAIPSRASLSAREKIEPFLVVNSRRMSTTRTRGRTAPPGRSGISTRVHETPRQPPPRQRSRLSSDGVAEPSTSAEPRRRASSAAASRAW